MPRISNAELIEKAVITTDALAAAGKLNTAQADRFIDYVIDNSGLKDNARVVRFRNESMDIDKIGVGSRVAMPKTEAVAPQGRRGVTTSKITLTPKEIVVPFEIGDNFREINLEGDTVEDHIIKMMATQLANDMEELYITGDTLGEATLEGNIVDGGSATQYVKDNYLALFDGWLKLARSANVFDAANVNVGAGVFSGMLKAMPEKFKRNRANMRFILSPDLEQNYREKVSTRATGAGDAALSSMSNLTPFGVPLVPFPLFPFNPTITEHITMTSDGTNTLLYAPIVTDSEIVVDATLDGTPVTPYVKDTDYSMDYANGTITHIESGGNIDESAGDIKVTYQANPQAILTHFMNFIVGIGRDIRIEKDRDIFKGVNQYAITAKLSVNFEELTAMVFGKNIGSGV